MAVEEPSGLENEIKHNWNNRLRDGKLLILVQWLSD